MVGRHRGLRAIAAIAALSLLAGACGDDDTESGSTSDPTASSAGEPIKIGVHGMSDLGDILAGFEEGVKFVNKERGGVKGRPIQVDLCKTDGSPESSINCANRFVQDRVPAAVQIFDLGADAMLKILKDAGIPEIGMTPLGPQAAADVGHSYFFDNPTEALGYTALLGMQKEGADKVRFFAPDDPATRSLSDDVVKPAAKKLGMDVDFLFYPWASPEWTSLVAAAKSQGAEGMGIIGAGEPECTGMMTAITQSGFKGATLAGPCAQFVTELGPQKTAGTMVISGNYLPSVKDEAPPAIKANLEAYEKWMTAAGKTDLLKVDMALLGFQHAVNVAGVLAQVEGEYTAANISATLPKVKGERFFGGQYACDGSAWPGKTACAATALILKVTPDGGRDVVGDGFFDLSKYKPSK